MPSKKVYIVLTIGTSLIWEMIKKMERKLMSTYFAKYFAPKLSLLENVYLLKKKNLLVRLASSLFLYNNEACKHGKAHLIHKNKQVLSIL